MSKGGNSPGLSRLAAVMRDLARGQVPTDPTLDFGQIQSNGSLLTNSLTIEIPKEDYLICNNANVAAGDFVLLGWVGNDAVVIDKISIASDVL